MKPTSMETILMTWPKDFWPLEWDRLKATELMRQIEARTGHRSREITELPF
jgi:hypothetical protein